MRPLPSPLLERHASVHAEPADGDREIRRTKVVATLGPACASVEAIAALIDRGVDCLRLNCSHGSAHERRELGRAARAAAERVGRPVALMLDLQGPKVRLDAATAVRDLEPGDRLTLVGAEDPLPPGAVRVGLGHLSELVSVGGEIAIGDGTPRLTIERVDAGAVVVRTISAGTIGPSKGVALAGADVGLPSLTAKDLADLDLAVELAADFVALSFVRNAADVVRLRDELARRGSHARVVAKIERVAAYERLDEILPVTDGVMVARGDYGIDAGLRNVPLMQKDTIARARHAGKLVITATQMLESMLHASQPTRAEVSDVVNAVLDGTSAVMLSGETSVGSFPVVVIETMVELLCAAERAPGAFHVAVDEAAVDAPVMRAAVDLARSVAAQAIVVPSESGSSARACSRYQPRERIVALCIDATVASQLALEWGVEPIVTRRTEWSEQVIENALADLRDCRRLAAGAPLVVAAGVRSRAPNLIALRELSAAEIA
jgi:pyruvate kinase